MTDFAELLRQHGTPLPNAVTMETEVRSEGALAFQTLAVPDWVASVQSSSVLVEWRCDLDAKAVADLQVFLKALRPAKPTEEVINAAFMAQKIGSYLGTFIEEGHVMDQPATVRVLFAYRSDTLANIGAINQAIYDLLHTPPPAMAEASKALGQLRLIWEGGSNRSETGLMLLSGVDLQDPKRHAYAAPPPPPSP